MKAREAYMRCSVAPGLFFPDEYTVKIPIGGGAEACAWAWRTNVVGITGTVEREKLSDEEITANWGKPRPATAWGWARVLISDEYADGSLWVTLPYESLNGYQSFVVSRDMVEYDPV